MTTTWCCIDRQCMLRQFHQPSKSLTSLHWNIRTQFNPNVNKNSLKTHLSNLIYSLCQKKNKN